MTLYNLVPYFLTQAALLAIFSLPFFFFLDDKDENGRVSNLDGLRGFLALAVFIHHGLLYFYYITLGKWGYGVSGNFLYGSLGSMGVCLFFMVTGFLFWGKLIHASGSPNWTSIYIGRVFRIGPLYVVTILLMTLIIFSKCDFRLNSSVSDLVISLARWLALGIDGSQPTINNWPWTPFILLGVTWTLQYEWFFYFSLPALALFVGKKLQLVFPAAVLTASHAMSVVYGSQIWLILACFASGALAATILRSSWAPKIPEPFASIAAVLVLGGSLFFKAGEAVPTLLEGVFFYLVCSSATLFGLLRLKASIRLGHISFGIYLLQGIPLTLVYGLPSVRDWATQTPLQYWVSLAGVALLLCLFAAICHALIERPGIMAGRVLARRMASSWAS